LTYWNDSLLTGVALIDDEHRKLFEVIDRLMEACRLGTNRAEIGHTLNHAVALTKEHIRVEENLQARCSYPGINAHKRLHAQFILSIDEIVREYEETGPNVALTGKLNSALVDWLSSHISVDDKKMCAYIKKAGG